MGRNPNADNDMWEAYERLGKNFRGTPSDIDDVVADEIVHPRNQKKKKRAPLKLRKDD